MLIGNPTGLVERAYVLAKAAHAGQERKYTGVAYITHPIAVAGLVATVNHTDAMSAAALLHDVPDDTSVTLADIEREIGKEVSDLVGWLSDVPAPSGSNRATRKALERQHIALAPAAAKTIRLADLIDNCSTIVAHDRVFAGTYLPEKVLLLDVLKEGDQVLWHRANDLVHQALHALAEVAA